MLAMVTKKKPKKAAKAPIKSKRAQPKRAAKPAAKAKLAAKKTAIAKPKASVKSAAKKKPVAVKPKAPAKVAAKPKMPAKTIAKPKAPAKPIVPVTATKPLRRRDGAGHVDPQYAAELLAKSDRMVDDDRAFLGGTRASDDLAEELGEEFVQTATTGEYEAEESLNQSVPEDDGGPFVESNGATEFARGSDASNPKGTLREPFPKT